MDQFILGLICGLSLFSLSAISYHLGARRSKPQPKQHPVNEEAKRKAEALQKGFMDLMNYDVSTAVKGKKVT